jgi:hypothetical protein
MIGIAILLSRVAEVQLFTGRSVERDIHDEVRAQ